MIMRVSSLTIPLKDQIVFWVYLQNTKHNWEHMHRQDHLRNNPLLAWIYEFSITTNNKKIAYLILVISQLTDKCKSSDPSEFCCCQAWMPEGHHCGCDPSGNFIDIVVSMVANNSVALVVINMKPNVTMFWRSRRSLKTCWRPYLVFPLGRAILPKVLELISPVDFPIPWFHPQNRLF